WIAAGASLEAPESARVAELRVLPAVHTVKPGETYQLRVEARFAGGSVEDITRLCTFDSLDKFVATVTAAGAVQAQGAGDASLILRYRAEPVLATVVVPRAATEPFPDVKPHNFIDQHVLAKLRRLNIPPADLTDAVTFLRRVCLDVTG